MHPSNPVIDCLMNHRSVRKFKPETTLRRQSC